MAFADLLSIFKILRFRSISSAKCFTGPTVHMSVKGPRESNEDRHAAIPFLNELVGIENVRHTAFLR